MSNNVMKSGEYYRSLDLRAIGEHLRVTKSDKQGRRHSADFREAVSAIAWRCNREVFTDGDLLGIIGEPDSKKRVDAGEVWEYEWIGRHNDQEFAGHTPFVVKDNKVIGIYRKGNVL